MIDHNLASIQAEIGQLNTSFSNYIALFDERSRRLEGNLQSAQQQVAAQVTEQLYQANQTLSRIQSGTDIIAINQYIANRMAGVDAYLA